LSPDWWGGIEISGLLKPSPYGFLMPQEKIPFLRIASPYVIESVDRAIFTISRHIFPERM
jgi:hypothetical protein